MKKRKADSNKTIINESGDITTDTTEKQRHHKRLSLIILCQQRGQSRINELLVRNNLPRLTHEEIKNLNIPMTSRD